MIELKPWEAKIVADLLEMAGDRFSCDCCEDYDIPNSREAHEMIVEMDRESGWNEEDIRPFNPQAKTLGTSNSSMCHAFQRRIRKQLFPYQR